MDERLRDIASRYDRLARVSRHAALAPGDRGGYKSRYVSAVFNAALMNALQAIAPIPRLLDFGCGTGVFAREAAAHCGEMVGIDVSAAALGLARSDDLLGSRFHPVLADGRRLPFADASFDVCVARESLCYIDEQSLPAALREIRRVLKLGASFLLLDQVSEHEQWQHHPAAPNVIKRSPSELRGALADAGLACSGATVVRHPRFPWIYPVALGLVPERWLPSLARREVNWHRNRPPRPRWRWYNMLFVARAVN